MNRNLSILLLVVYPKKQLSSIVCIFFSCKIGNRSLLFTPRPSTRCLVWAKECGLPCIRPFAKGELPMGRMPLLFTAQPLFGWGVKSNNRSDNYPNHSQTSGYIPTTIPQLAVAKPLKQTSGLRKTPQAACLSAGACLPAPAKKHIQPYLIFSPYG